MKLPSFTGFTATHRLFAALFLAAGLNLSATTCAGKVVDENNTPLAGVKVTAGKVVTTTGPDGRYEFELPSNLSMVMFNLEGFSGSGALTEGSCPGDHKMMLQVETVTVTALRVGMKSPATVSELRKYAIEQQDHGQDIPALLTATPSITSYGEAGGSGGYSYFALRGIGTSRINLTLDGVPLNDPEEMQYFFANTGDLTSSLDSIQVQRGVGTSSVGAAAWGGSINFASLRPADDAQATADLGAGSFGGRRFSLAGQTGEFGPGLAVYGRATKLESDGYRDHSGVKQESFFLGGRVRLGAGELRLTALAGRERSQLAFYAVTPAELALNPRANGNAPQETDEFRQQVFQLAWVAPLGVNGSYRLSAYRNAADGWFDLLDWTSGNLLRYKIDGASHGATAMAHYKFGEVTVDGGLHAYRFSRIHAQDDRTAATAVYTNTGRKRGTDAFVKAQWDHAAWHLYGDLQARSARFSYEGSVAIEPVSWNFLNPKAGVRYDFTHDLSWYASVGRARREPARSDLFSGEDNASIAYDLKAVRPETVTDYELGVDYKSGALRIAGNLYAMEFRDEIAATGELTVVGYPLRKNTGRSSRRGIELEYGWVLGAFKFEGSANVSRNRIAHWSQYYDIYDGSGNYQTSEMRTLDDVRPLLTPELSLTQSIAWRSKRGDRLSLTGRYVGSSQLDNTEAAITRIPGWFRLDAAAEIPLWRASRFNATLRLNGDNLLDRTIYASGYSYAFLTRDANGERRDGAPYLYPQSGRGGSALLRLQY